MAELTAAADKLVQYLNEAYGLEQKLQTSLEAHVAMTSDSAYEASEGPSQQRPNATRARYETHQTARRRGHDDRSPRARCRHRRRAGRARRRPESDRARAGTAARAPRHRPGGEAPEERQDRVRQRVRGDRHVQRHRGARAGTRRRDTQKLAREILREEERMRSYLEKQIPRFTNAVVKAEIPASQRAPAAARRKAAPRQGKSHDRAKASRGRKAKVKSRHARQSESGHARQSQDSGAPEKVARARGRGQSESGALTMGDHSDDVELNVAEWHGQHDRRCRRREDRQARGRLRGRRERRATIRHRQGGLPRQAPHVRAARRHHRRARTNCRSR